MSQMNNYGCNECCLANKEMQRVRSVLLRYCTHDAEISATTEALAWFAAGRLAEREESDDEPLYTVTVECGRVYMHIDHQSFEIDTAGADESPLDNLQRSEWFAKMLRTALDRLVASARGLP